MFLFVSKDVCIIMVFADLILIDSSTLIYINIQHHSVHVPVLLPILITSNV